LAVYGGLEMKLFDTPQKASGNSHLKQTELTKELAKAHR